MAVGMERNGQNEDIFWSSNNKDLMMDVKDEGKRKNDDCQISGLSSWVTGGIIYDAEKTG